MDARDALTETAAASPQSPRKVLTGRLIALGAIPIAVFCAIFVVKAMMGGVTKRLAFTPSDVDPRASSALRACGRAG